MRSPADTDLHILALWHSEKYDLETWINLNQIQKDVGAQSTRLREKLEDLEKLEHLRNWNDLEEKEKKEQRKKQPNFDWGQTYIYKITEYGVKTFRKIRDQCLDDDTRKLLRLSI
jgi:hypothetical protein